MSESDYNIEHYTFEDMLEILNIDYFDNVDEIYDKTDERIVQGMKMNNPDMAHFFQSMQDILVSSFYQLHPDQHQTSSPQHDEYMLQKQALQKAQQEKEGKVSSMPFAAEQTEEWLTKEALPQSSKQQMDKVTDRYQRIQVYKDNDHMPMNREQLGVNNTFSLPVAQDTLNPNLKNVTNRFLILDSQFRQYSEPYLSTDYIAELSDTLNNVISLRLYSVQIPTSWYVFDVAYQNTDLGFQFFLTPSITEVDSAFATIQIPNGNYADGNALVAAINAQLTAVPITGLSFSYQASSNRITFTATSPITYLGQPVFDFNLIFFDPTLSLFTNTSTTSTTTTDSSSPRTYNQTLGWAMGFRNLMHTHVMSTGGPTWTIVAEAVLNLNGFTYFVLSIDDFNQNHINNSPVNISPSSKSLPIPYSLFYANADQAVMISPTSPSSPPMNIPQNINPANFAEKYGNGILYSRFPQLVNATLPRKLTLAQMYSANEKIRNNKLSATNISPSSPSSNDVLAIIPIKTSVNSSSFSFTDFSGPLQDNKRDYFGPVNLERLRIRLKTDTGKIVNLNGLDWSFVLVAEILYQY